VGHFAPATSATALATGVTEVAADDHRYCIQGDDFPVARAIKAGEVSVSPRYFASICRIESSQEGTIEILTEPGSFTEFIITAHYACTAG
jgi:hypothetical protein